MIKAKEKKPRKPYVHKKPIRGVLNANMAIAVLRSKLDDNCTPEQKLLFAIIDRMIRDASGCILPGDSPDDWHEQDAKDFMEHGAFDDICALAGICPRAAKRVFSMIGQPLPPGFLEKLKKARKILNTNAEVTNLGHKGCNDD